MTKRVLDTYEADRNYYVLECAIPPTPPPPFPAPALLGSMVWVSVLGQRIFLTLEREPLLS
jgi:hypothetical protein